MAHILVAYASRKGTTTEIAQAIGKELQAAGHIADVMEIGSVSTLAGYHGVVIGGPMYMGRMVGDVGKFVKRFSDALAKLPVATFIVGLTPVSKDPESMAYMEKALHKAVIPLQPVAEAMFAGRLDPANLGWLQRWMIKNVKSPVGDFRDWTAIAEWAK
ncbi:MAG TPA: flavodoxin domain-containing protein, partial [Methanoregulaceae archaeon]|nr:flavodoxin domain-containing protein [Methanoregulaceae archaeon]